MAEIKKIYEDVALTKQILPETNERAVYDDNGTPLNSKLGQIVDLLNQKQLAIGSVPSDLTPTKNSTNWVTSNGVFDELNSNVEKTPIITNYYRLSLSQSQEYYESSTIRVATHVAGAQSVDFASLTSGYKFAVHQWNVVDPTVGLEQISGTLVNDSTWLTTPQTIQKLPNVNYVVVYIAKTNDNTITEEEAFGNVSFKYYTTENKFDVLQEEIDEVNDKIEGADSEIVENNENANLSRWATYTVAAGTRGIV